MIKTFAKVVRAEQNIAYVEVEKRFACDGCGETACGVSALGKFFGNKSSLLALDTPSGLKVGDTVEVGLKEKDLLHTSLKVYFVPLAIFFIFAIGGTFLKNFWSFASELSVALLAFVGMGFGFIFFKIQTTKNPVILLSKAGGQIVKFEKESK